MIHSFSNADIEKFFKHGKIPRKSGWQAQSNIAKRKLDMLDYAVSLNDLLAPPSNRLEALKGNLNGYYSIRINDQWRIVFKWENGKATNVNIVDYHK